MVTPRRTEKTASKKKKTTGPKELTWERVKQALQRDWAQTRADFSDEEDDLRQNASDTVRQATGKQHIPPEGVPNPSMAGRQDWEDAEPAVRYGFTAHRDLGTNHTMWSDELDRKLERGWNEEATGMPYEEVREAVKLGWETAARGTNSDSDDED